VGSFAKDAKTNALMLPQNQHRWNCNVGIAEVKDANIAKTAITL
jgi:hypothetical protein